MSKSAEYYCEFPLRLAQKTERFEETRDHVEASSSKELLYFFLFYHCCIFLSLILRWLLRLLYLFSGLVYLELALPLL